MKTMKVEEIRKPTVCIPEVNLDNTPTQLADKINELVRAHNELVDKFEKSQAEFLKIKDEVYSHLQIPWDDDDDF